MTRTLVSQRFFIGRCFLLRFLLSCSFILSSSFSHQGGGGGGGVSALPLDQVHTNNTNNISDTGPIPNPNPIPVLDNHHDLDGTVDGIIGGGNDKAKAARRTCETIAKRFSDAGSGSAGRVAYPGVCKFFFVLFYVPLSLSLSFFLSLVSLSLPSPYHSYLTSFY